jgi:hypothetical protein
VCNLGFVVKVRTYDPLSVDENGVLKKIFGPERETVRARWRKLDIEFHGCTVHQIQLG